MIRYSELSSSGALVLHPTGSHSAPTAALSRRPLSATNHTELDILVLLQRCKAEEEAARLAKEASDIEAWKVARTMEEQGRLSEAILSHAEYDHIKRVFCSV